MKFLFFGYLGSTCFVNIDHITHVTVKDGESVSLWLSVPFDSSTGHCVQLEGDDARRVVEQLTPLLVPQPGKARRTLPQFATSP